MGWVKRNLIVALICFSFASVSLITITLLDSNTCSQIKLEIERLSQNDGTVLTLIWVLKKSTMLLCCELLMNEKLVNL